MDRKVIEYLSLHLRLVEWNCLKVFKVACNRNSETFALEQLEFFKQTEVDVNKKREIFRKIIKEYFHVMCEKKWINMVT